MGRSILIMKVPPLPEPHSVDRKDPLLDDLSAGLLAAALFDDTAEGPVARPGPVARSGPEPIPVDSIDEPDRLSLFPPPRPPGIADWPTATGGEVEDEDAEESGAGPGNVPLFSRPDVAHPPTRSRQIHSDESATSPSSTVEPDRFVAPEVVASRTGELGVFADPPPVSQQPSEPNLDANVNDGSREHFPGSPCVVCGRGEEPANHASPGTETVRVSAEALVDATNLQWSTVAAEPSVAAGGTELGPRLFLDDPQVTTGQSGVAVSPGSESKIPLALLDAAERRWFWTAVAGFGVAAMSLAGFALFDFAQGGPDGPMVLGTRPALSSQEVTPAGPELVAGDSGSQIRGGGVAPPKEPVATDRPDTGSAEGSADDPAASTTASSSTTNSSTTNAPTVPPAADNGVSTGQPATTALPSTETTEPSTVSVARRPTTRPSTTISRPTTTISPATTQRTTIRPAEAVTTRPPTTRPTTRPVPTSPVLTTPVPTSPVPTSPVLTTPVPTSPVPTTPVPTSPVLTTPVPTSPVLTTPVPTSPVLTTPVLTTPSVTDPPSTDSRPTDSGPGSSVPDISSSVDLGRGDPTDPQPGPPGAITGPQADAPDLGPGAGRPPVPVFSPGGPQ